MIGDMPEVPPNDCCPYCEREDVPIYMLVGGSDPSGSESHIHTCLGCMAKTLDSLHWAGDPECVKHQPGNVYIQILKFCPICNPDRKGYTPPASTGQDAQ